VDFAARRSDIHCELEPHTAGAARLTGRAKQNPAGTPCAIV
jgi:hypothetical protein